MVPFILESLATGHRQTLTALTWKAALDAAPGDHFLIIPTPDGRFMAGSNQNSAFKIPAGHFAETPEAAAASLKEHYATIVAAQESKDATTTKH